MSILYQGEKGIGKIPHLSLIYFSPLVALPLRGEKSNPFFSSVKDWVIFFEQKQNAQKSLLPRVNKYINT